ncbi:MAG: TetM/TetW/TetO/TetS family tetracycline resistance ribosomal protection protein [Clostridiales bacterium]|nr:TetM/TetW/TetO/TetS family tetracycline resistance ribosomal protection protein [Clostridiales bacterium]
MTDCAVDVYRLRAIIGTNRCIQKETQEETEGARISTHANGHIRNIGIFAHVDAGKTTLSEQLLLHAGAIRETGSVDTGTAHTDTLPVERRRGISVKATCVRISWKDTEINLIDTPGHVDFSAEVERSLWALDAAVLVLCGVEGVQPQTEVLFAVLKEQKIPTILFINKMDREGADVQRIVHQINNRLTANAALLNDTDALAEAVCSTDDELLERFLAGESFDETFLHSKTAELTKQGQIYPILTGSALRDLGIEPLLNAIVSCLPAPVKSGEELCGVVFAAEQDRVLGRGVWVRLYSGHMENRMPVTLPAGVDPLTGEEKTVQQKVTQIRDVDGTAVGKMQAGEIGIVYGLGDVRIGQVLGNDVLLPRRVEPGRLRTPLITVQVIPENPDDMQALRTACETLSGEDPLLQARYVRSLNEQHMNVMGTIQLEILAELLKTRFDLNVLFSKPAVLYRETIAETTSGYVAYTMPKPCWAIMEFVIEPAPRGSGVTFESRVPVREILARYQHQVEQALPLALAQGRLGWPVTDVKITLVGGNHHQFHTHPLDFIVATPMGIQDGLRRGGSVLLEPILEIRFHIPQECVGRVMSDVVAMRGEVQDSAFDGERSILTALVPVQTSLDYASTLASVTGGRGTMSIRLHSYRDCPLELGATAKRRSVDPLDTSRYILAARSALEGGIFDVE